MKQEEYNQKKKKRDKESFYFKKNLDLVSTHTCTHAYAYSQCIRRY